MVYRGSSIGDEGERIEHRVVFTVTGLTKEIAGVRAAVGWDRPPWGWDSTMSTA